MFGSLPSSAVRRCEVEHSYQHDAIICARRKQWRVTNVSYCRQPTQSFRLSEGELFHARYMLLTILELTWPHEPSVPQVIDRKPKACVRGGLPWRCRRRQQLHTVTAPAAWPVHLRHRRPQPQLRGFGQSERRAVNGEGILSILTDADRRTADLTARNLVGLPTPAHSHHDLSATMMNSVNMNNVNTAELLHDRRGATVTVNLRRVCAGYIMRVCLRECVAWRP
jgi:hypothetical protein